MARKKIKNVPQPPTVGNFPENTKAKRWLWIGVLSFTVMIAIIWLWSFETGISQVKWSQTSESQLIKSGYDQLNGIIKNESSQLRQQYFKTQLKRIVGQIIAETSAGTSTDSIKEGAVGQPVAATSSASTTINQSKK